MTPDGNAVDWFVDRHARDRRCGRRSAFEDPWRSFTRGGPRRRDAALRGGAGAGGDRARTAAGDADAGHGGFSRSCSGVRCAPESFRCRSIRC